MQQPQQLVLMPQQDAQEIKAMLKELLARMDAQAASHKERPETDFPQTGPVGVNQIIKFIGCSRSGWWLKVEEDRKSGANRIQPIEGFANPRKWQAEAIWAYAGY